MSNFWGVVHLGWTISVALGVRAADPQRKIVALSGDYDFQFMIEELAVGAQFKLPYMPPSADDRQESRPRT